MCGITGIFSFQKKIPPQWIYTMTNTLRHRGPDDEGYLAVNTFKNDIFELVGSDSRIEGRHIEAFGENVNLFLGHRRLSIIDISPAGHQPMCNDDKTIWIVYNGEIYNYIELREELKSYGFSFKTASDTEVLIKSYEKWGENCVSKFNGMWAFKTTIKEIGRKVSIVKIYDSINTFCDEKSCYTLKNDKLLYADDDYLSVE